MTKIFFMDIKELSYALKNCANGENVIFYLLDNKVRVEAALREVSPSDLLRAGFASEKPGSGVYLAEEDLGLKAGDAFCIYLSFPGENRFMLKGGSTKGDYSYVHFYEES